MNDWIAHADINYGRDPIKRLAKFAEEAGEVVEAVLLKANHDAIEEIADAALVLVHLCDILGGDLWDAMKIKSRIVMDRPEYKE